MLNRKKILIIGSTGSVGCSAITVVLANPTAFKVEAVVAKNNYKKLAKQALAVNADYAIIENIEKYQLLKKALINSKVKVIAGLEHILQFIDSTKAETIFIASSGTESLHYLQAALQTNKNIAIANKESIISMGHLLKEYLKNCKAKIIPVDSEHSAIFQSLETCNHQNIHSLILTSSGGPFFDYSKAQLKNVTVAQALKHPQWQMGKKISIDSATFINKALEVIEAGYLFDIPMDKIEVVIEKSCKMHGGVRYLDGSLMAHLSLPSMEVSSAYGLTYPARLPTGVAPLNLFEKPLIFNQMNEYQQEVINLVKVVFKKAGNYPLIFNTANEIAVEAFLNNRITFTKILYMIQYSLDNLAYQELHNFDDVIVNYTIIKSKLLKYINNI